MSTPRRKTVAPPVTVEEIRHASGRVLRYIVICGSYRAELHACLRDECANGDMMECTVSLTGNHQHQIDGRNASVDTWLKHIRTHCHGYHNGRVQRFAQDLAKTYGSYRYAPYVSRRVVITYRPQFVANALGITEDELAAEMAKARA